MSDNDKTETEELSLDRLKRNLENKLGPDQVVSDDQLLIIPPPGVSIGNIRQFLEATLSEIPGLGDIIPESLPVDGITLSSLTFLPKSTERPYLLEFSIGWPSAQWELIPGVLSLEAPEVTVIVEGGQISGQVSETGSSSISGTVSGVVEIGSIPLYMKVELPNGSISAELLKPGEKVNPYDETAPLDHAPSSAALMQQFQVGSTSQQSENAQGFDLGALTLEDLTVLGSIPVRRLLLHLALSHIQLGPGDLALQLTIDYFGGPNSQLSGLVWGQYNIHKNGSEETLFSIMLAAAYDGPGKSWKFEGGAASAGDEAATIADLIAAFTDTTDGIPGVFDKLGIRYLHLAYETGPGNFEFQCDVEVSDLFEADVNIEMIVDVHLHKVGAAAGKNTQYAKTFSGRLLFKLENGTLLEFDLLFDQSPIGQASDTSFIAAYKNPSGGDLNIGDLIQVIEPGVDVPLSIKLQDAFFIYDKHSGKDHTPARSSSLFGLDIGGGIDLSALPLVGKIVPSDASLNFGIQPLIALGTPDPATQAYFSEADLARLGALIPGGGITLPATAIKEQIGLGISIALGKDLSFHFDLPIHLKSKVEKKPQPSSQSTGDTTATPASPTTPALNSPAQTAIETTGGPVSTSPATAGVTPAPDGSSAGGVQWINVGKTFGPVHFNRLGLQFEADQKMVWAYLDAGLSLAALTFTLNGLGMGTPIDTLDPKFRLLGIGIDYKSGPVEIGASFLHTLVEAVMNGDQVVTPAYDEYSGLAIIKTPTIGLSAVGSYADLPDYKSLFIYAVLNAPLGGPSFFFVTGLAAGFGFNRAINVPDVSQVEQFPLVNLAAGGTGSPVPADPAGRTDYIHDILNQLRGSIYPMQGEYFLAAGIHFTSFQLIDSFALLIVRFGEHFEVDVLGLSTVTVPASLPGGPQVTPVAEVQLALKAVFNPAEGVLSVEAQLTDNSYILDKKCHLTGGFAFYSWFAGPHQGDFVLSLGGYHPAFQKPDHYPTVPRLGLNWQVTPELSIRGGIYFALCPHLVMAGGRLEGLYQSGTQKAWFTLAADFLISWKPYHYDARVSLDIGVEYTYHLFGTHHIQVTVGADMHVWGPEFAGHANLHLWIVTFDIDFGATTTPKLEPIDWATFQQSFLPKDTSKMVHISVMDGLLRKEKADAGEQHVINPRDFRLGVDLVIPYESLRIGETDVPLQELHLVTVRGGQQLAVFRMQDGDRYAQEAGEVAKEHSAFGIAPMARSAGQITSTLWLVAEMEDPKDGTWLCVNQDFGFRPVRKRVPRALWGETLQQELNGDPYVNALSGMEVLPVAPPRPGETQWAATQDLQYTTTHIESGIGFEPITPFTATELGTTGSGTSYLRAHLTDATTMNNRRQLLEALGFDYNRLGIELRPDIADALVMDPQIGTLV